MEKLLTVKQLCDMLQIKPSTVYKWVHYSYIPYVKLGDLIRFKKEKVDGWIEKRERRGRYKYKIDI